jgi:hypothetical protein
MTSRQKGQQLKKDNQEKFIQAYLNEESCAVVKPVICRADQQFLEVVPMTQEEIITRLIGRLDFHLNSGFGSVHKDPYKNDIFELFQDAYRNDYFDSRSHPRLTGDALRDTLQARWNTANDPKRRDLAEAVLTMWDEWRYAWDRR